MELSSEPVSEDRGGAVPSRAAETHRLTFFRQSGWMAVAAMAGGVFNMASNFVAQRMPEPGQFNTFETAMSALGILGIPALGMQATFAAQAAAAGTDEQRRGLAAAMRGAMGLLGVLWLALAGWWWLRHEQIAAAYGLTQPAMLWVLLFILLVTMLTPVPQGIVQGRQDFLWFGWAVLLNGAGRLLVLAVVVRGFSGGALSGLIGVLAGSTLVLGLVTWRSWDALTGPRGQFAWRDWLRRLVPVTIGLGALSVIMQADAIIVREKLQPLLKPDEVDGYSAVRKIAQAMVFIIGALTSVMYPKVARSSHRTEAFDVLKLTLAMTALIGVAGATLATLFPELPLRLLSPGRLLGSRALVPAYCWALVPVALASVLVWNLLARECYRAVPWMAAVALGHWFALQALHNRLLTVIGVVGASGLLLLAVCLFFLWREGRRRPAT